MIKDALLAMETSALFVTMDLSMMENVFNQQLMLITVSLMLLMPFAEPVNMDTNSLSKENVIESISDIAHLLIKSIWFKEKNNGAKCVKEECWPQMEFVKINIDAEPNIAIYV